MTGFEANFDGLVGPTHNYAGLSYGNVASMSHKSAVSNPREAVLQGLMKAKALADLGFRQGLLAPQERPDISALRRLGFSGKDSDILRAAQKQAPELLAACCSASSMWSANAATVSPSSDSLDSRVHFTAANLNQKFHRAIESATTARILRAVFPSEIHFAHHEPLPASDVLGDEGAANHTRFCADYGAAGLQFFVFGRAALQTDSPQPKRFPARQTREASESIARLHQVPPERLIFAQQNPECIDTGAFHNDVVSVGNQNVLFFHEQAFYESERVLGELHSRFEKLCNAEFTPVRVDRKQVPLSDAVSSYLFNSQLITTAPGIMALIAPAECQENPRVRDYLGELLAAAKTPIREIKYFNLRQSMNNGGGPACLRLRVVLNEEEWRQVNPRTIVDAANCKRLTAWAEKHYRDKLSASDLADPQLLVESRAALDELTQLMNLGSIYNFQK